MSWTTRFRLVLIALFCATVLVVLAGWIAGRDASNVAPVVGWAAAALGVGEASNVGKRATFKAEAGPPEG